MPLLLGLVAQGAALSMPVATKTNTLLLDHININHERGRHDLVSAFYFDVLGLAPDQRKAKNVAAGKGTVWANLGINQFHLSEGDRAQVIDGSVTLGYESLGPMRQRLASPPPSLSGSAFRVESAGETDHTIELVDPWGSRFICVEAPNSADPRGSQPGAEQSEARALLDITLNVPSHASLAGIGRFYTQVLGCKLDASRCTGDRLVVLTGGEGQTLTFVRVPRDDVVHDEAGVDEDGRPLNSGVHLSLYLADMRGAYERADALGVTYVNHRFKRRAYTAEEAAEQCMFRVLDVVDPEAPAAGPIVRLEHEVRSVVTTAGDKYKSCPFDELPAGVGEC